MFMNVEKKRIKHFAVKSCCVLSLFNWAPLNTLELFFDKMLNYIFFYVCKFCTQKCTDIVRQHNFSL